MPWIPFKSYTSIFLENSNAALYAKAVKSLEKIESMIKGRELLADMAHTLHRLEIKPIDGNGGSSTGYATNGNYTLLGQAIVTQNGRLFQQELTAALGNAERFAGLTREKVASQLAQGLTPATYIGKDNVGAPANPGTPATVKSQTLRLDDLTSGRANFPHPPGIDTALQRILRNWLTPGRGCACDIEINIERPGQCWTDGSRTLRYPTICLAHELVHAWRGMTGRMLYATTDQADLEEVITTGLPPYNFEKFSENIFRSQFPDDPDLPMRTSY